MNKIDNDHLLFTMAGQTKNQRVLDMLNLANSEFGRDIDLLKFIN